MCSPFRLDGDEEARVGREEPLHEQLEELLAHAACVDAFLAHKNHLAHTHVIASNKGREREESQ